MPDSAPTRHRVVIVGGGFGGLYAAQHLARYEVEITLLDRRNFHLFQPLLYQVATGGISPGDITAPLRSVLKRRRNVRVEQAEVTGVDARAQTVALSDGNVAYDTLIVATGVRHHYFGNDGWESYAPGLKTVEDALHIRRRIFLAFETAEREPSPDARRRWMRFVIIGGGPTGVELAGAVAELAHRTLRGEFRVIRPEQTEIILVEGMARVLPTFPRVLSAAAVRSLSKLGVTVRTGTRVTSVDRGGVTVTSGDQSERIDSGQVLWAAGVQASPLGRVLADSTGAVLDRAGRLVVESDLTLPGHPEIFVIGDLANFSHQTGEPLPGIAPVAMQQGAHAAGTIAKRLAGARTRAFRYQDKGKLAVIGRNAAVADLGRLRFSGWPAWILWVFVHIAYLIEFDNRVLVITQWAFDYFTRKKGARLITGKDPNPLLGGAVENENRKR